MVVLNNKEYISLAIENFLGQQCEHSELVIVDGASSDGTRQIIESFAKKHFQIRWISEKDKGQSDAMNKAIRMSNADYISFLNVDDFYQTGALNEVCSLIHAGKGTDFMVGNCHVWDNAGKLSYINRPKKLKPWHILSGRYFLANPTAYFYKKCLHKLVGFYNPENHYNMDLEFVARVSLVKDLTYHDRDWGNFRLLVGTKTMKFIDQGLLMEGNNKLLRHVTKSSPLHIRFLVLMHRALVFVQKIPGKLKLYRHIFP